MSRSNYSWDFFIAHAEADKEIAEDVYDRLISCSRVFLDSRCLKPGDDWDIKLRKAQKTSFVTLVLISSNTDKAYYQREEIAAAIDLARSETHRVVPVYLNKNAAKSDSVPYGLRLKQGLTLSDSFGLEDLRKAVLEVLQIAAPPLNSDSNTYLKVLPVEVEKQIERYQNHISRKEFSTAFHVFFERPSPQNSLNYVLDFVYSHCDCHLDLVSVLFANVIRSDPPELTRSQRAKLFNALARAYKNTGQLDKAIETFERQLLIEVPAHESRVYTLANFVNALRLAGRLYKATDFAYQLLHLSEVEAPSSIGYSLYWNGIVSATRGHYNEAELLLRQAELIFEAIAEDDKYRGLGRMYAHMAQIELWLGHADIAWPLAKQSYLLAENHKESREFIFTSRLMGMAALTLRNYEQSREHLAVAQESAAMVGYFEEELEATIGLAELDYCTGKFTLAEQKLRDVERRAWEGGYLLLRVDSLNALTKVLRKIGRDIEAIEIARTAYKCAHCDGRPYAYERGLKMAGQHLIELKTKLPVVVKANEFGLLQSPYDGLSDEHRKKKAHLRCKFAEKLRIITGPYRYSPTKFIKLLQDDWEAVCQIVKDQPVTLTPQYVEIHVGEPCNLSCVYCRGKLRIIPNHNEKFLPEPELSRLVDEIYNLNNKTFIRFSGLIGEPLMHPKIVKVFNYAHQKGLRWGVTTNGLRMAGEVLKALINAEYVHVSLDAGSDRTYQKLKNGKPGNFNKVLQNVEEFVRQRGPNASKPQLIVSVLLQKDNYSELKSLSERLKKIGVDSLEIKMQHFDARRRMSRADVKKAYRFINDVRRLDDDAFCVVVVQTKEQALDKVGKGVERITFPRCYANELGLNATIDPQGNLQTCCQYYQKTLGVQGSVTKLGLSQVWGSIERTEILGIDPRNKCVNCSPSDEFVNKFVDFLSQANKLDADFLHWAEEQIALILKHEV